MEAIGSGLVVIVDGHDIKHSNIADIPDGNLISIENLKVHFCEKRKYLIKRKKVPSGSEWWIGDKEAGGCGVVNNESSLQFEIIFLEF